VISYITTTSNGVKFLERMQNLPLRTRKIIFWLALIVLAAGLFWWRFGNLPKRFDDFQAGDFLQKLNLPDIEIPKIPQIKINGPEETQIQEN